MDLFTTTHQTGRRKEIKIESECVGEHAAQTNTPGSTSRPHRVSAEPEKTIITEVLFRRNDGGSLHEGLGEFGTDAASSPALSP